MKSARHVTKRGPWKCHLRAAPVPPYIMDSVSVDLFAMPLVEFEGQEFGAIFVCACRTSGYIIAEACQSTEVTAEKLAKMMWKHWDIFGIPSVVTSDGGPHFIGGWWQTLCAHFGVRIAYAQAYHHQANGFAEVAGQK